jgi:phage terminase large subunit-like protein
LYDEDEDIVYILDCFWEQCGAGEGDESVRAIAFQDGKHCKVRWELEGGSAGLRYEAHLKRLLEGFDARGEKPMGDKVTRALPWAQRAKEGKIKLWRGSWNDQFLSAVHQFDGTKKPLINDIVDSGSGCNALVEAIASQGSFKGNLATVVQRKSRFR